MDLADEGPVGGPPQYYDPDACGTRCGVWYLQNGDIWQWTQPPLLVGADLGIYLPSTGLYCKFKFTHWGEGGGGEVGWVKNCFYDL